MRRRHFLHALSAAALALAAPSRVARADASAGRRFLFVFAEGGWDPLCVFAPLFDAPSVEMEPGAAPMQIGDLALVDHPGRPGVRAFFERWGSRTIVFNGVNVRSVAHEVCTQIALTGRSSDTEPDWASRLAGAAREGFALPHLSFSGPVLPGSLGAAVVRAGASGQLAGLLDGTFLDQLDVVPKRLGRPGERIVDRFAERRVRAFAAASAGASSAEDALVAQWLEAKERSLALKELREDLDLYPGFGLRSQAHAAVKALADGLCRCVSVGTDTSWDTHVDNNLQQGPRFEKLFRALDEVCVLLQSVPGPSGRPLADDTVVVVMSEMARTPKINGTNGRDHWPFTSALVLGPGLTGGRVIGGYDELYTGAGVDRASGESAASAPPLTMASLGATLLLLGDVDPGSVLADADPIEGALA
jgi:hypothetical protein